LDSWKATQIASGDTKKNIKANFDERLSKTQVGLGVAKAALTSGASLASTDTSALSTPTNPSLIDKQAINSANAAFGIPSTFQGVNPNQPTVNNLSQTSNPLSQTINTQNGTTFDPASLLSGDIIGGLAGLMNKKKAMEMGQSNIYLNY